MPIGFDTYATRGRLPHLSRDGATYFVTFCTFRRRPLPPAARDIVLTSCVYDHGSLHWLHCAIVMPDHVHLLMTPYVEAALSHVLRRIKSASSYHVTRRCDMLAPIWQRESFDHLVRSTESLTKKAQYIADNPVRKGLVAKAEDWPWWYCSL